MKVMLPILKASEAPHFKRSDLIGEPEEQNQNFDAVIHSSEALTQTNIN